MLESRPHTHRFVYLRTEQREVVTGQEIDPLTDEILREVRGMVTEDVFYCENCLRYERVMQSNANVVIQESVNTEGIDIERIAEMVIEAQRAAFGRVVSGKGGGV